MSRNNPKLRIVSPLKRRSHVMPMRRRGNFCIAKIAAQLSSLAKLSKPEQQSKSPEAVADQSKDGNEINAEIAQKLSDILKSLMSRYESADTSEKKEHVWNSIIEGVNKFRETYGNLPRIQDARGVEARLCTDAIIRGDGAGLLKVLDDEKEVYAKRKEWTDALEKLKSSPYLNVVATVALTDWIIEFVSTINTLLSEGMKYAKLVNATPEEAARAQEVI